MFATPAASCESICSALLHVSRSCEFVGFPATHRLERLVHETNLKDCDDLCVAGTLIEQVQPDLLKRCKTILALCPRWPSSTETGPNLVDFGPSLVVSKPRWVEFGQCRAKVARHRAKLRSNPGQLNSGQCWSKSGQCWSTSGRPMSGRIRPRAGQIEENSDED